MRSLMIRAGVVLLALAAPGSDALAQDWAVKMFPVRSHDFGTVPRGSQPAFAFELTNPYEEMVEIAEVRTSCGCTTPRIAKRRLSTWEKGSIVATLNTTSFTGHKKATLTVVFSKPFRAEVQLSVEGSIRSDVVLNPWRVDFKDVRQGESREQTVQVTHAGQADWQIVDVLSANPHFEVELLSEKRTSELVAYDMLVRLKGTAPAGYFQDQLSLVTSDGRSESLLLPIQGRVLSPVTVSPTSLFLGVVQPGQSVTKRLVVRAAEPFRILEIDCGNAAFEFEVSDEAKPLHMIPVTFAAGASAGPIVETIRIATDLSGGVEARCTATAKVLSPGER